MSASREPTVTFNNGAFFEIDVSFLNGTAKYYIEHPDIIRITVDDIPYCNIYLLHNWIQHYFVIKSYLEEREAISKDVLSHAHVKILINPEIDPKRMYKQSSLRSKLTIIPIVFDARYQHYRELLIFSAVLSRIEFVPSWTQDRGSLALRLECRAYEKPDALHIEPLRIKNSIGYFRIKYEQSLSHVAQYFRCDEFQQAVDQLFYNTYFKAKDIVYEKLARTLPKLEDPWYPLYMSLPVSLRETDEDEHEVGPVHVLSYFRQIPVDDSIPVVSFLQPSSAWRGGKTGWHVLATQSLKMRYG